MGGQLRARYNKPRQECVPFPSSFEQGLSKHLCLFQELVCQEALYYFLGTDEENEEVNPSVPNPCACVCMCVCVYEHVCQNTCHRERCEGYQHLLADVLAGHWGSPATWSPVSLRSHFFPVHFVIQPDKAPELAEEWVKLQEGVRGLEGGR